MTITRERIQQMRTDGRLRIDAKLEDSIITQYSEDPDGPEYTEQDLYEQIRKPIYRYNQEHAIHPQTENHANPWDLNPATQANLSTIEKELTAKISS